ncbi:MAG: D-alanine--D-alanine ligase [Sphaerochaeta sp.]
MKIALTYDLKERYLQEGYTPEEVAELDSIHTIEAIENVLRTLGHESERIGSIFDLTAALVEGRRWPLVFNIAEGLHGLCREAQIPALLEAYRIPYVFSDSFTLAITLHKAIAKMIVHQHGVPTSPYAFIQSIDDLNSVTLTYPLFAKPISGGTGMGINEHSIINKEGELQNAVANLLVRYHDGVLLEEYLPGREFTVGIVGTHKNARVIGVMEIVSSKGVYSYESKQNYLNEVRYLPVDPEVSKECSYVALNAYRALQCRDGGRVDVKMDQRNAVNFIEVNPLAGLHPIDSDLPILAKMAGIEYHTLIKQIVDSALERVSNEQ